ncbi:hypothetical protein C8K30_10447 [Promicromonospora sp. AC04]|nr:hypothetical protein C8K30_10447 [Promicromonospora sp. AC04]
MAKHTNGDATRRPAPSPLFRDPVYDGAADPTVIWNRAKREWWMFYTNRRAWSPPIDDVSWVHGTDIGIAISRDGGTSWLYRGIARGLGIEPGRHTYWAPEVLDDGETYHMYVSVLEGVPTRWEGHDATIRHYTSGDLVDWRFESALELGSPDVIDACVFPLPEGGFRMWFKDRGHTYAADSPDLYRWQAKGPAVEISVHEGPNVFALGGAYWMLVDEWAGLRVLRSDDLETWHAQGRILDVSGNREDDRGYGLHADVVVVGDDAYVFYFTHPGREPGQPVRDDLFEHRRSSVQVARARVIEGRLVCDRDAVLAGPFLPTDGPRP